MIMNFIYQNELRDSQISVCRGVLILPYKNGYLSTVCCDIALWKRWRPLGKHRILLTLRLNQPLMSGLQYQKITESLDISGK